MPRNLLSELVARFPNYSKKDLHARVLCGEVTVDGEVVRDPKRRLRTDVSIDVRESNYVSRGGRKLESALDVFGLPVAGRVFLDAGASTGGFTDCLLRRGAVLVHAVDSGHNQLAYALRRDPRVRVYEDTPIQAVRELTPTPHAAVVDISFRSVTEVIGHVLSLTKTGEGIVLLKPQFEWPNPPADFDGVIRGDADLESVAAAAFASFERQGIELVSAIESPIRGHAGNREFLLRVRMPRAAGGALTRPEGSVDFSATCMAAVLIRSGRFRA